MHREIKLKRLGTNTRKFRNRTSGGRLKWPKEVRDKAVALMGDGISLSALSRATGIAICTLSEWREQPKSKSNGAGFKRLKVVDRPKFGEKSKGPAKLFVTTPQGSEVHGLTPDDVAMLIKRGAL